MVQKDKKFTSLGARGLGQILHRSRQLAAVLVVECWLDLRKEALSQFRFASALSCGGWGKLFNAGINPTKSVSTPVKISVYSRMHSLELQWRGKGKLWVVRGKANYWDVPPFRRINLSEHVLLAFWMAAATFAVRCKNMSHIVIYDCFIREMLSPAAPDPPTFRPCVINAGSIPASPVSASPTNPWLLGGARRAVWFMYLLV